MHIISFNNPALGLFSVCIVKRVAALLEYITSGQINPILPNLLGNHSSVVVRNMYKECQHDVDSRLNKSVVFR